jgi:hypothetical protein
MPMTERSRAVLYRSFTDLIHDPQAVQEMLSHFPAQELEVPATKDFVRAEIAVLRREVLTEVAALRAEMHALVRSQTQWLVSVMIALLTLQGAAITLLSR